MAPVVLAALTGFGVSKAVSAISGGGKNKDAGFTATQPTPDKSQMIDAGGTAQTSNLGRAALISTSPTGVQGLDPTGRRRILGN